VRLPARLTVMLPKHYCNCTKADKAATMTTLSISTKMITPI
jgi:hypothetical protein